MTDVPTCAYNDGVTSETHSPASPIVPGLESQIEAPQATPAQSEEAALDFDKAVYAQPVATQACAACKQNIIREYYEVAGQVICAGCRDRVAGTLPDKLVFLRALLYGGLAAAAGTLVWSLIIYLTNYELGLIAIVVGVGVGIAVRKGSRGRGGWKYQTLAMALTYISITTSYVPIIFKGIAASAKDTGAVTSGKGAADRTGARAASNKEPNLPSTEGEPDAAAPSPSLPAPIAIIAFLGLVWGLALAAPFLAGASNIMGIIIIAIGLYEAWKYNRRVVVNGPFRLTQTPMPETADPAAP